MAEAAASARRATDGQMSEDAERLIAAWNERQARGMPMSFSPTLRMLDRHPDAAVTSLIPSLSCRSCRPNAPFAKLVRFSKTSIADEMREEQRRRVLGE